MEQRLLKIIGKLLLSGQYLNDAWVKDNFVKLVATYDGGNAVGFKFYIDASNLSNFYLLYFTYGGTNKIAIVFQHFIDNVCETLWTIRYQLINFNDAWKMDDVLTKLRLIYFGNGVGIWIYDLGIYSTQKHIDFSYHSLSGTITKYWSFTS